MTCKPAAPVRGLPKRVHQYLGSASLVWALVAGGAAVQTAVAQAAATQTPAAQTAANQTSALASETLKTFLAALESNPELLAAQAATDAVEAQLHAARDPVALAATGGYSRVQIDESQLGATQVTGPGEDDGSGGFASGTLPANGFQLSTTLSFRPIAFGDVADAISQGQLALESSRLDLQSVRTGLEVRALEAALSSRLAERSVALAQQSVEAATQSLRATRLRVEKGAANARDLRGAEEALLEAQTLTENAQSDANSARLNLNSLVGETPAPSFADLASLTVPQDRTPLAVAQAQIQRQQTALGITSAQRELYPVAQASYTWNVSNSSSLTASLESRTLQPSLGYAFQDPARTAPESAVTSALTVGISANISLSALDALEALEKQQTAAAEALRAQQNGGNLQRTTLSAAYGNATRSTTLENRTFRGAQLTYQENLTRQTLGLSSPLETSTSLIELIQADLDRSSSELASLSALLDIYELYALPPSETLP